MLIFCPIGHIQNGLPAMGGICEICSRQKPENFICKESNCDAVESEHMHPDENRDYFLDINGNRIG